MTEFLTDLDIRNRALQHCGARRVASATEVSKENNETKFVYGKLRRAELERNTWTFATKRAILRPVDNTTMLLAPGAWVSTVTYFVGSIVADGFNNNWSSKIPDNVGNDPTQSPNAWEPYFGTMTVQPWLSTTTYFSGELVYTAAGDGTNRVFISLQNANADNPATATAWSATASYNRNAIVTYLAVAYMSRIDLNLNQVPATTFAAEWAVGTTYGAAAKVTGSDGTIYSSIAGGNIGNDPVISPTFWTNTGVLSPWDTTFVSGTGSMKWRQIGGAEFPNGVGLRELNIIYPLNTGPTTQESTRNIYRLPNGYLKTCSQDPKAGATSYLGAEAGLPYKDWLFESGYIVSRETDPIMFRFVADVTDVSMFQTQFAEGLACRLALEVCEGLTNSSSKLADISKEYDRFMNEARRSNAIEAGSEEPPVDDYIAARL